MIKTKIRFGANTSDPNHFDGLLFNPHNELRLEPKNIVHKFHKLTQTIKKICKYLSNNSHAPIYTNSVSNLIYSLRVN